MRIDRCKRCGKNDLMYPDMFMCQSCRTDYQKIKKNLDDEGCEVLDELLDKHFNTDDCGCNYENEKDIRMCPIGMFENGCSEEDLIKMVKDVVEQRKKNIK